MEQFFVDITEESKGWSKEEKLLSLKGVVMASQDAKRGNVQKANDFKARIFKELNVLL